MVNNIEHYLDSEFKGITKKLWQYLSVKELMFENNETVWRQLSHIKVKCEVCTGAYWHKTLTQLRLEPRLLDPVSMALTISFML